MKKLILALTVVLSVSTAVAQNGGRMDKGADEPKVTAEQRAQRSVDKMDKTVTLTATQKTQIYNLALSKAKKMETIHEKYKDQPEQKETARTEMKTVHQEYDAAVKPILTPEQSTLLEAKQQENKEHQGHGDKLSTEERAQKTVDKLDNIVTLTPDQKAKIYPLALSKTQKTSAIREKYKDQPEKKEAAKTEMKAAHEEYKTAADKILTPEQITKLKVHKEECKKEKGNKGKINTKPSVKESEIPGKN